MHAIRQRLKYSIREYSIELLADVGCLDLEITLAMYSFGPVATPIDGSTKTNLTVNTFQILLLSRAPHGQDLNVRWTGKKKTKTKWFNCRGICVDYFNVIRSDFHFPSSYRNLLYIRRNELWFPWGSFFKSDVNSVHLYTCTLYTPLSNAWIVKPAHSVSCACAICIQFMQSHCTTSTFPYYN